MKDTKDSAHISWQRICLIVLCVILALILGAMIFATAYIQHLLGFVTIDDDTQNPDDYSNSETLPPDLDPDSTYTGPTVDHEDITIATLPSIPKEDMIVEGVVNIMLIGEDRRPGQGRQRSDSMILCSFNKNHNSITMVSFLRDTYVSIPGYGREKLNAAYAHRGASLLNQTLATNFGVHVDANVMIDFDGFTGIINMLGGVDIELTKQEASHLNKEYGWSLSSGMQHLNGEQALGYSRIRKIDMDAMRAQRQRKVLTALINSYKSKSLVEMLSLASDILQTGFVQTDMTSSELTGYIMSLFPMLSSAKINNQQIPAANSYQTQYISNLGECKIPDLAVNRRILQKIFNQS